MLVYYHIGGVMGRCSHRTGMLRAMWKVQK